jgi:hypothetical protein
MCSLIGSFCNKVWREGLFYKMMLNKINGKMYNVIINMYDSIKSCSEKLLSLVFRIDVNNFPKQLTIVIGL